jgi:hypothetical protein
MIAPLENFGRLGGSPRDTALAYGDKTEQLLKDVKEIGEKINEIIAVLNRAESDKSSAAQQSDNKN